MHAKMTVENDSQRTARLIGTGSGFLLAALLVIGNTAQAAPVKVAFTGDQGTGEHAQAVLSLIASEGTDLLLIQGDLGYDVGASSAWEANLSNALGADFPVLALVGNHENYEWPLYQRMIQRRIGRASDLVCSGEVGVKALCRYGNIDIVQVSPGINEVAGVKPDDNYAQFIETSFAQSNAPWRICSWHKNQSKMQTGSKNDATGWEVYDACLDAGAMIALAHEHAYSRTHLLSNYQNQTIAHKNSDLTLEPGRSFAFVSGLGGREVRPQLQGGDWWASIYTATQNATHGALFCTFEEKSAQCYFKAIDGAVPDQFSLNSAMQSSSDINADTDFLSSAAVEPNAQAEFNTNVVSTSSPADDTAPGADAQLTSPQTIYKPSPPPGQTEIVEAPEDIDQTLAESDPDPSSDQTESSPFNLTSNLETTIAGETPLSVDARTELFVEQPDTIVAADSAGGTAGSGSLSIFGLLVLLGQIRRNPTATIKAQRDSSTMQI